MAELTHHVGELIGQTPEERLAAEALAEELAAQDQLESEQAAATQPDVAAGVTSGSQPAIETAGADEIVAAAGSSLDAYAFPFSATEVFGILPQSLALKAEGAYRLFTEQAGDGGPVTLSLTGLGIAILLIAIVSTLRVWRRGDEFAVAGFGDRHTPPGFRYKLRQEPPLTDEMPPQGEAAERSLAAEASAPHALASPGSAEPPAESRVKAQRKPLRRRGRLIRRDAAPAESAVLAPPQIEESAEPPVAAAAATTITATPLDTGTTPPQAEDESPRRLRRKLFRKARSGTGIAHPASFQVSFGSFQSTDRFFAGDYLKQTNEAYESAYLRRGLTLSAPLSIAENPRAERLFMMATRAAFEDPQAALAALWQAVDEAPADAVAWLRLAHFYMELGESEQAMRILEPLHQRSDETGPRIIAAASANSLGKIAAQRGETERAKTWFGKALAASEAEDNPYMAAVSHANLGTLIAAKGRAAIARTHLEASIAGFDGCGESVSAARARVTLGALAMGQGENAAAYRLWDEAQRALRKADLAEDAARVERWVKGDGAPDSVSI